MFETGTRVILLSSSFRGKTGPKKGSIGYVSDISPAGPNPFFDNDNYWFVATHRIFFVRYGFEKESNRIESKFFLSLTPYVVNPHIKASMSGRQLKNLVDDRIEKTAGFTADDAGMYRDLRNMIRDVFGNSRLSSGIVVPLPPAKDLLETDDVNFQAWLECMLKDDHLVGVVEAMLGNLEHVGNILRPDMIDLVHRLMHDKEERMHVLKRSKESEDVKHELIETIKQLAAVGDRSSRRRDRQAKMPILERRVKGNPQRELKSTLAIVKEFNTSNGPLFINEALNANDGDSRFSAKMTFLLWLKQRLVSLARSLEGNVEVENETVNN